jgi:hypothetical protein
MKRATAVVLVACGPTPFHPRTEVHLRELADVRVEVDTPEGRKVLVAPGREPSDATVPNREPPFSHEVRFDASVSRERDGNLIVRCGACGSSPFVRPLSGTELLFVGAEHASEVVHLDDHDLHIPFTYRWTTFAPVYHKGSGTTMTPQHDGDAFALDLVTPLSNVVDVRERTDDPRPSATGDIALGVGLALAGVAGTIYGFHVMDDDHAGVAAKIGGYTGLSLGIPLVIVGPLFVALGIGESRAIVWDRHVYPR